MKRIPIVEHEEIFEQYIARAVITGVKSQVKSGKEAVVFRCGAHPSAGVDEVAVKIYKDIGTRSFRNMNSYLDGRIGRTIRKRRDILHLYNDPDSMQGFWVSTELGALETLHAAGLPVPKPLGSAGPSIAMEFIPDARDIHDALTGAGRAPDPAPRLRDAHPSSADAAALRRSLLAAIEGMLGHDLVHGDLSPYNILVRDGRPVIIDFPQAADARFSTQARAMFDRDVYNVLEYFRHSRTDSGFSAGAEDDPERVAAGIWARYESGELYRSRDAARLAREWGLSEA